MKSSKSYPQVIHNFSQNLFIKCPFVVDVTIYPQPFSDESNFSFNLTGLQQVIYLINKDFWESLFCYEKRKFLSHGAKFFVI